MDSPQFDLNYI